MDLYVPSIYVPPMEQQTRLHPLEVQAKEVQCHTEDETTTVETPTPVRRPQRL